MSDSKSRRIPPFLRSFIVFLIAFDLAFIGQKFAGAYESEFGAHPDEAAHCVTGLFVRDAFTAGWNYACGGFQGSPAEVARSYSETFYLHYPKVALGVWPPAFHTVQALWTLPFGASRLTLMLLMAALAGATATVLFGVINRQHGLWAASVAALIWLAGPLVVEHTSLLMAEMLSALTMFGATLVWGKYLERGRPRDALWFAMLASAAILTKGTGLALILMCGISVLVSRKWNVLARPALWVAAFLVILFAGVWTWVFRHEGTRVGGWEANQLDWAFTKAAVPFYLKALFFSVSGAVAVFACVGMIAIRRANSVAVALGSSVLAILVFQALVPVGREARHILAATPAMLVLATGGIYAIARHATMRVENPMLQLRRERLWVLLLALLSLPQAIIGFEKKSYEGFAPLAVEVLQDAPRGARILVCSDASGEGRRGCLSPNSRSVMIARTSSSSVGAKAWSIRKDVIGPAGICASATRMTPLCSITF
jgi:hypothetical protein